MMMIPPIIGKAAFLRIAAFVCVVAACSSPPGTAAAGGQSDTSDTALAKFDAKNDVAPVDTAIGGCASCPDVAHGSATCTDGVCGFACHTGYVDCDGKPENGCEVGILEDVSHCGGCGQKCADVGNGSPSCSAGKCVAVCDPGWMICQADQAVCDMNVESDATHCGDCTTACSGGPNAAPECFEGGCRLNCNTGFADCNGNASDGCEVNIQNDSEHCGACGISCNGGQCINAACECASVSQTATLVPVDLFFMVDQSSSMTYPTGTGMSKWDAVVQAIDTFVKDKGATNLGVGIQYFPLYPGCTAGGKNCGEFSCNMADYAAPEIGIAPLAVNASKVSASLFAHKPLSGTPTYPALQGALDYAKTFAAQNPTHTVVVVLATDGVPDGCNIQDIPTIAALATAGVNGTPKVLTYVIGVGSSLTALNKIAVGGGTSAAFIVDNGGNVVDQFGAALKAIQGKALGCGYEIPQPTSGQTVDFSKVNVQVTLGNSAPQVLNYVASEAKCDPAKGGWHFDDPLAPTKILLCGPTCGPVGADSGAKVEILLGCDRTSAPQ
jgi:hypothetical protein